MTVRAGFTTSVATGGLSAQVWMSGVPHGGGFIVNPLNDQGLLDSSGNPKQEKLFVSLAGPAGLAAYGATSALAPGQSFIVPPDMLVWVNAATSGHLFSSEFIAYDVSYPPGPVTGLPTGWPATAPTGLVNVIPSYLYKQYQDDDDLQALVIAQNAKQQDYVDTFNGLNLPIYSRSRIAGPLLDWVGSGVYGYPRPTIYAGFSPLIGPLNTYVINANLALNAIKRPHPVNVVVAGDDLYKRCLTWHVHKADGKYLSIRWLKRRVMRFLTGGSGTSPPIDQTNQISVTFGQGSKCGIRLIQTERRVIGGAIPNRCGPNGFMCPLPAPKPGVPLNGAFFEVTTYPPLPNMGEFAAAVESGALEMPFRFRYVVIVG